MMITFNHPKKGVVYVTIDIRNKFWWNKSTQKQPKMAIFAKIDFWGLKYPPEVLVELKR